MKKILAIVFCCAALLLTLVGCGTETASSGNASGGDTYASYGNYVSGGDTYVSSGSAG